ncbi:DUF262 domain-containing protein [Labrenzia sp. R5_0]|jgi:hypothetical protein|uniref:DUF262 domain-containing protein n=1 Tax=Labrenzia sp. R5_0 TaxID=2821108 RepID=UPI001ADC08B0|nr:DUF262 domain-containing protein [Labrenzia sp. R5_0]MBO9461700.1 DUF262 domain-containing protein [Labrenzia sp. R5_0]
MSAKTTFYGLIERHGRVEIPIIQRDYAQGRPDQHIVRDEFLKALYDALCLPEDDPSLPLDLDFIYGSVVNEEAFQPLDGQQRLTTLFLLHWYLAWADGQGEDFRARLVSEDRSFFSYEVRPSSRDFINALANYAPEIEAVDCDDLVAMITDQPWYFRSWRLDPTIRSALLMLERMHEIFRNTSGIYERLVDHSSPVITFQLLDLEQFDLSDDLYIKMNARGKPLTNFETFKARFERHIESQFDGTVFLTFCTNTALSKYFAHQIDTRWSDFFWPFRDRRSATFDDAVMNLLRTIIMVTRSSEIAGTANDLADLRSSAKISSYSWFHEKSWLDQEMVVALITVLERWSSGSGEFQCYLPNTRHLDEKGIFEELTTRPTGLTFEMLAQLAGYVQYFVHNQDEIEPTAFDAWMRVVSNLAINTDYNRPEDLRRSLGGIRDLVPWMNDVILHISGPDGDIRGFFRDQVAEERIKARLIALGNGWPERIERAERHSYFRGQIGFLLHFCGLDLNSPDEELDRLDIIAAQDIAEPFEHYLACATQMFNDLSKDPMDTGRLWERALLAIGNYLPLIGRNHSLLTMAQDEAWSWKRFLRNAATGRLSGEVLRELWDRLGDSSSFVADLSKIIEQETNIDPWRQIILSTPEVYGYGHYRMLRFSDNGGVYLLRKSQMNGRHAELFTYCLFEELQTTPGALGLTVGYEETTSTDDEPGLILSAQFRDEEVSFYLQLGNAADSYELYLRTPREPQSELEALLKDADYNVDGGFLTKKFSLGGMKAAIFALDSTLKQNA